MLANFPSKKDKPPGRAANFLALIISIWRSLLIVGGVVVFPLPVAIVAISFVSIWMAAMMSARNASMLIKPGGG